MTEGSGRQTQSSRTKVGIQNGSRITTDVQLNSLQRYQVHICRNSWAVPFAKQFDPKRVVFRVHPSKGMVHSGVEHHGAGATTAKLLWNYHPASSQTLLDHDSLLCRRLCTTTAVRLPYLSLSSMMSFKLLPVPKVIHKQLVQMFSP